jgi:hypothetical protein
MKQIWMWPLSWVMHRWPSLFMNALPTRLQASLRDLPAVRSAPCFRSRIALFEHIEPQISPESNYFEFGVHQGESIRIVLKLWGSKLRQVVGFDSFEGLPESWQSSSQSYKQGAFDVQGQLPRVNDDRVTFVKGWFAETWPDFVQGIQAKDVSFPLVVHLDSDLYSSAVTVLSAFTRDWAPSIVLCDEWTGGEALAVEEWLTREGLDAECLGWVQNPVHLFPEQVALRIY